MGSLAFRLLSPSNYDVSIKHPFSNNRISAGICWFGYIFIISPTLKFMDLMSPNYDSINCSFSLLSALCLWRSSIKSLMAVKMTITTKAVHSVGNPFVIEIAGIYDNNCKNTI